MHTKWTAHSSALHYLFIYHLWSRPIANSESSACVCSFVMELVEAVKSNQETMSKSHLQIKRRPPGKMCAGDSVRVHSSADISLLHLTVGYPAPDCTHLMGIYNTITS